MTVAFKSPLTSANINAKLISRTDNQDASGIIDFVNGLEVDGILLDKASGVLDIGDTGGIKIPDGTTAQRPSAGNGVFRYNTTNNKFEAYENGSWSNIIGVAAARSYRNATTTDSITTGDDTVLFSGASFTATLPTAVGNAGKEFTLIHGGTSLTQNYTLQTTSSQTIGGVAGGSYKLVTNGETLVVESDGANWRIAGRKTRTLSTSFTPTLTGFGTVSSESGKWRREGNRMRGFVEFVCGTVGTSTGSLTIPGSQTLDTNELLITGNTTANPGDTVGRYDTSVAAVSQSGTMITAPGTSTSLIYISNVLNVAASHVIPTQNVSSSGAGTGSTVHIVFDIPITDWQP
jgi:hypothetical protein